MKHFKYLSLESHFDCQIAVSSFVFIPASILQMEDNISCFMQIAFSAPLVPSTHSTTPHSESNWTIWNKPFLIDNVLIICKCTPFQYASTNFVIVSFLLQMAYWTINRLNANSFKTGKRSILPFVPKKLMIQQVAVLKKLFSDFEIWFNTLLKESNISEWLFICHSHL